MALDLAGENSSSAGAQGTEPARCRHKCRWNEQGTGREKNLYTFEGTSRLHTGPVRMQVRPVKCPVAGRMPIPGKARGKHCAWQEGQRLGSTYRARAELPSPNFTY
jgi:hypothetical protein